MNPRQLLRIASVKARRLDRRAQRRVTRSEGSDLAEGLYYSGRAVAAGGRGLDSGRRDALPAAKNGSSSVSGASRAVVTTTAADTCRTSSSRHSMVGEAARCQDVFICALVDVRIEYLMCVKSGDGGV